MSTQCDRYRSLAGARAEQLGFEELGIRRRLAIVRALGWPLLTISIVFPVAAGTATLVEYLKGVNDWLVPLLGFTGGAAVALHQGFQCETFHSDLKRNGQAIRGIVEEFERASALPDELVAEACERAENRLKELRASTNQLPPRRCGNFAELLLSKLGPRGEAA